MNDKVLIFLAYFNFESLSLIVHHSNVNDTIRLEPGDVKINWRSVADLGRYGLNIIN